MEMELREIAMWWETAAAIQRRRTETK